MHINLQPPSSPEFGWITRILIQIAGADKETLKLCPPRDVGIICAIAWLMLGVLSFQTTLFALIGHELFARPGEILPEIILGALALSTFIVLVVDRFAVVIPGHQQQGRGELLRGGLEVGKRATLKMATFLFIRIGAFSSALAVLSGIFFGLIVYAKDVNARIEQPYLAGNARITGTVTGLVDDQIRRTSEAVTAQTNQVEALSAQVATLRQRQIDPSLSDPQIQQAQQDVDRLVNQSARADDEMRAAKTFAANEYGGIVGGPGNSGIPGRGLRYQAAMEQVKNAETHAQEVSKQLAAARDRLVSLRKQFSSAPDVAQQRITDQLPDFEKKFDAENLKLGNLKDQLATLIAGRDKAIRDGVENAPDHVSRDDGLLARIAVLERIAREDPKVAVVIILIDFVSFGLELSALLSTVFGGATTTFSALQEKDKYMRAVRIVEEMIDELNDIDRKKPGPSDDGGGSSSAAATDGQPANANDPSAQPPKRKRGRPRKHPLPTIFKGPIGPGGEGPRPNL
jgi:hypothetical protein